MCVINGIDRYHLVMDVIELVPTLRHRAALLKQEMRDKLVEHKEYIKSNGDDMPEVKDWAWKVKKAV